MSDAERLADAASALVGAPFRLHGRDPATGIDCVGLLLLSLRASGRGVARCPPYSLRNRSYAAHDAAMAATGFVQTGPGNPIRPGDVILASPGPMQRHILIANRRGMLIHAHAGLRRVVTMPAPSPWPKAGRWRLQTLGGA